jgi:hypothetical protein
MDSDVATNLALAVEVRLPADGVLGHTDDWFRDPIVATSVAYRAHRDQHARTCEPIVVVSVTAYSRTRTKSWMDPRYFVAAGLDAGPPPAWVPEAPAWFWDVVADMAATVTVREPVAP